ncbi:MAG: 50S ribosomal protein L32e [Candidatus Bathyarchaeia archaeon]
MASLRVRRRIAARRPKFRREESWRYAKLAESWRRPRGGTSKVRLSRKGWPARVKVGYRGPKAVRGLHTLGFREVLVHSESELQKLDREREAVRIAHTVGARRRASIVEGARSLGLKVLNPGLVEAEAEMAGEEKQEA